MALVFDLVIALAGFAIFTQHVLALRGHFVSTAMSSGAKVISAGAIASLAIMLLLLFVADQPLLAQLLGLVAMGASLLLFRSAVKASRAARLRFAFDNDLPDQLVTVGPYRSIRHPFYTSYLIYWAGWGIAVWSIWAVFPWAIMAALYTIAAQHEERLLSDSGMGAAYAAYRQRAGLFWPRLTAR